MYLEDLQNISADQVLNSGSLQPYKESSTRLFSNAATAFRLDVKVSNFETSFSCKNNDELFTKFTLQNHNINVENQWQGLKQILAVSMSVY